jgi:DNA-binding LacI/PurR family transcriptional regulator/signal transduction histidine kinase
MIGFMAMNKKRIGIFTASLDDEYQSTLWSAISHAIAKRGFSSISFLGSVLGSPVASEASSNIAYRLANDQNIDGLIIISSSVATFLNSKDLREYFSAWANIPRVSIGMKLPGMSDVTVDSEPSVSELVQHLYTVHNRRKFAMIDGPPIHDEAINRKQTVFDTLTKLGISIDPRLRVHGRFTLDSGERAMEAILATGLSFDTVICLNDRMAQGALNVLAKHSINVPDDVSVVGFDGIEASRYTQPPLTTVIQPMHNLGTNAVAILERMIGGGAEEHVVLSSSVTYRESCGCAPTFRFDSSITQIPSYATQAEERTINEFAHLLKMKNPKGLIAQLNRAIDTTIAESGVVERWHVYLAVIENLVEAEDEKHRTMISDVIASARVFVGERSSRYQASKRVALQSSFETLRTVSAMLAGTFELEALFANLKQGLALFGITEGYLIEFTQREGSARLLIDLSWESFEKESSTLEFEYAHLLPEVYKPSFHKGRWILMPLVHGSEPLGYLIVPSGMVSPALYAVLQEQISSSLKGTLLLEQIKSHEQTLIEQVALRTKDLIRTNKNLSNEIKRRIELEEEVMEISAKTMERIGQELHDDLAQHLLGISLIAASARKSINSDNGKLDSSLEQISRLLAESITKLKTISRGLLPLEKDEKTFAKRIEALVADTQRYVKIDITVDADPDFEIADGDRALHVFRIIQEALTNAVKHSKSKSVLIKLERNEDEAGQVHLQASIEDNGVGFAKNIRKSALGLRIMRNRASMADAILDIQSSPEGTRVSVRLEE